MVDEVDVGEVVEVTCLAGHDESGRQARRRRSETCVCWLHWAWTHLARSGRRPLRWTSSNWPGGSSGPRRWQRGQRSQRGNGLTGMPVRVHGSSLSFGSQGGVRSVRTCGPSVRRTCSSSRGSSMASALSCPQLSMLRTTTLIEGRSTTAPIPEVLTRWLGRAPPTRLGWPRCPIGPSGARFTDRRRLPGGRRSRKGHRQR
jgi:hypothetical protein